MSASFMAFFYAVYWAADRHAATHTPRLRIDFPFEAAIPFVPWAILVYLTITPLLLLAPFVFRSSRRMRALFVALCLEVIVAGVIFVAFPAELGYPNHEVTGWAGGFMSWARWVNLTYNLFPSLHVAFALTAAAAFAPAGGKMWRIAIWCWGLAIVASTLLAHQHHLVDVAAGGLLSAVIMQFVYPALLRSGASPAGVP